MKYIQFSHVMRSHRLSLFALDDVCNLFPNEKMKTIKNNLTRWLSKGYCVRLKRDCYELREPGLTKELPDFYVANGLYQPSYVSLETALSFYSMIPDVAAGVTSVTTRPTRTFKNHYGSFFYRTCKQAAFTGYRLAAYEGYQVALADREKALVDFLYFRLRSGFPVKWSEERFNQTILKKLNWQRALKNAVLFGLKTVKATERCREYAGC